MKLIYQLYDDVCSVRDSQFQAYAASKMIELMNC